MCSPPMTSPRAPHSKVRSWSSTSTTTTWAACWPSIWRKRGQHAVSYVTPAGHASAWTIMSNEQPQIHRTLAAHGITLHTLTRVTAFTAGEVTLANQFTNAEARLPCRSLVIVGARFGEDALYGHCRSAPRSSPTRGSARSRASAMRSPPGRSCMRSTAAIATRRNSTRRRTASPTGAMRRSTAAPPPRPPRTWRTSLEHPAGTATGRTGAHPALQLVQLAADLRRREGAHLLPRVDLRRARGGTRRAGRPPRAGCPGRKHPAGAQPRRSRCARSTTSAATAARACAARPATARRRRCPGGDRRWPHHLSLPPVDLRLRRPAGGSPLPHRGARLRQVTVQPLPGGASRPGAGSSS